MIDRQTITTSADRIHGRLNAAEAQRLVVTPRSADDSKQRARPVGIVGIALEAASSLEASFVRMKYSSHVSASRGGPPRS